MSVTYCTLRPTHSALSLYTALIRPAKKGAGEGDKKGTVAGHSHAGREAARRMQRQRDREGSRSTSPKGLDRTQRSDYELADRWICRHRSFPCRCAADAEVAAAAACTESRPRAGCRHRCFP